MESNEVIAKKPRFILVLSELVEFRPKGARSV